MIVSLFLFFIPNWRNGGRGPGGSSFGTIYGQPVTRQEYLDALSEFKLFYLFHYGTWPEKKNVSENDLERETYIRLLLIRKAEALGIHVGVEAAAAMANQMLRSLSRGGEVVSVAEFSRQILQPAGLAVSDFENFTKHDVAIQQLMESIGSSGALVTPKEAAALYTREHQERVSQILYFSAAGYLSSVKTTPEAVALFYTNYLAEYRVPDRVQIHYVAFELTNYLAKARAELAKTNLSGQVDALYFRYGPKAFPNAKTPDDAKAEIRQSLIDQQALVYARAEANEFATTVFNLQPVQPDNLKTAAKQQGLTVRTTGPFSAETGPQEFSAPESFVTTAFSLTPDEPFANPIITTNGVYVIALAKQLPSEIPALADIHAQVTHDYQMQKAADLARVAGTNLFVRLNPGLAAGKAFAAACDADGLQPQALPPFSLSTREMPELKGHTELNEVKRAAFTTAIGHISHFVPTDDGGFILFVQSQLPVDQAVMAADLPRFTESVRVERENEAFNAWLSAEAGRILGNMPFARRTAAGQ